MQSLLILIFCLTPAPAADESKPFATLKYSVTDSNGNPIPARITLTDELMTPMKLFTNPDADPKALAIRNHAFYTLHGEGEITVPASTWDIMTSHGIEWSIDTTTMTFEKGKKYEWHATLVHEVDTTDWVSGDFHLHTLTHSGHGDSNMNERIISIVGEGLEFAVATDHNHNTDYQPIIDDLEAHEHLTAVVGNEVSTSYGHMNTFPLHADSEVIDEKLEAHELFTAIRNEHNEFNTVPIIQINHPRWGNIDYFGVRRLDPVTGESNHDHFSWDFDSIELLNENPGWGFFDAEVDDIETGSSEFSALRDWYNFLNAGRKIAAVGNSDSHTVIKNIAGIPRNYLYTGNDDASNIDPAVINQAIRDGNLFTTTGPFLRMTANGQPLGSTVSLEIPQIDVQLDAQVASWIDLDSIAIIQNGEEVANIGFEGRRDGPLHVRPRALINAPRDCWIIAIATGDEPMKPYVMHDKRDVTPLAITNPIYIDANGDGKWTPPAEYLANALEQNKDDFNVLLRLFNELNPTEQSVLVLESAVYPNVASKFIRLGLSSEHRIVKLSACKTAQIIQDEKIIELLIATMDNPKSDRFLAYLAWAAVDATDSDVGKKEIYSYATTHGWDNAKRYAPVYPMNVAGEFVKEWEVARYFAIANDDDRLSNLAEQKQIPEPGIVSITLPTTTDGNPLAWEAMTTDDKGFLNLSIGNETENVIAYARCFLWSPDDREVDVTIGSDDACRLWIEDELVWDDATWHSATPDQNFLTIKLKKGWNTALFKVLNGLQNMGLYFRVIDDEIRISPSLES